MYVSDHGGLLRARDGGEQQVTPFELFFDLVFVFAVVQLSHRLLRELTVSGALETLLLLLVVWSTWVTTTWVANWFDPDRLPVRLMLAGLVMSVAIPWAFLISTRMSVVCPAPTSSVSFRARSAGPDLAAPPAYLVRAIPAMGNANNGEVCRKDAILGA